MATAVSVTTWMREASAAVAAEADHLTQLDSAIGDGDHGVNLTRGFKAVVEAVDGVEEPPGKQLILAGKTLVSKVGGASGPLWGTALRRAGRAVGSAEALDGPRLVEALAAGWPASSSWARPSRATRRWSTRSGRRSTPCARRSTAARRSRTPIAAAADAAEAGARATVPMQARKGRASYLGERSVGHQDPGATSTALIVRALGRAFVPAG